MPRRLFSDLTLLPKRIDRALNDTFGKLGPTARLCIENLSDSLEFTGNPAPIVPDIFYVPEASNYPAHDSFLLLHGLLLIFQFTIGSKHSIKPKLIHFLEQCAGVPPMEKWIFVFVIPPSLTLTCPQPRDLKLLFLLYSLDD